MEIEFKFPCASPESTGYQDLYCSTTIKSDLVVSQCEGGNSQTWLTDGWIGWLDGGINMNRGSFHLHAIGILEQVPQVEEREENVRVKCQRIIVISVSPGSSPYSR